MQSFRLTCTNFMFILALMSDADVKSECLCPINGIDFRNVFPVGLEKTASCFHCSLNFINP